MKPWDNSNLTDTGNSRDCYGHVIQTLSSALIIIWLRVMSVSEKLPSVLVLSRKLKKTKKEKKKKRKTFLNESRLAKKLTMQPLTFFVRSNTSRARVMILKLDLSSFHYKLTCNNLSTKHELFNFYRLDGRVLLRSHSFGLSLEKVFFLSENGILQSQNLY